MKKYELKLKLGFYLFYTLEPSFIPSQKLVSTSSSSNNGPQLVSHMWSCLNQLTHISLLVAIVVVTILLSHSLPTNIQFFHIGFIILSNPILSLSSESILKWALNFCSAHCTTKLSLCTPLNLHLLAINQLNSSNP